MIEHPIVDILRKRRLVLDGAMGSLLQEYGFAGNSEALNASHPDVVREIHHRYLEAGADIISTNTFSAQRISQADYGTQDKCYEWALIATQLAREEVDKYSTNEHPRFVAGSVGPTNVTLSMSEDVNDPAARKVTFEEMASAYEEQIRALIAGGVDLLLMETQFDTLNTKAALYAADEAMLKEGREVPIMLSVTLADRNGRMLAGQTIEAFVASTCHNKHIISYGVNCSFGAAELAPFIKQLAERVPYFVSAHPNAGLPDEMGKYVQTAQDFCNEIIPCLSYLNIVGGCCGTTDAFIREVATYLDAHPNIAPREILFHAAEETCMTLAGLEPMEVTPALNFVNIGERCNVAGSRKFLRLIKEKQYDEAIHIARQQVQNGAQILDINLDDGMIDAVTEMKHFLCLLAAEPDVARLPWMIDSSNWEVIRTALRCVQGKCIVNSISLKEGEAVFLSHARELRQYGAAVVVMAFDEEGQATTFERRISICERAYHLLVDKVGFPAEDIIFDPNVLAICTGMAEHDAYALDFIRATQWIRENLKGAHVSGGVSNLSFSFRGNNWLREAMHAVFLYHSIKAGQDMGIVNPASKVMYADIPNGQLEVIENAILCRKSDASERLLTLAQELLENAQKEETSNVVEDGASRLEIPLDTRLAEALIKGDGQYLEADITEALSEYERPVDIIEGPLMNGMNIVGERFGAGQMFLPQVVKTARTMKQAVSILDPYIKGNHENESDDKRHKNVVVMATVKGDVHDIGKNICSVILACNGYEIIDLGVMVSPEAIVDAVKEHHAALVGLSGLITPSLAEMTNTVDALANAGCVSPVMVGGATTSELHTALKIEPASHQQFPVVWTKDASQMAIIAAQLLNVSTHAEFEKEIQERYAQMRKNYAERQQKFTSLDDARKNKLNLFE